MREWEALLCACGMKVLGVVPKGASPEPALCVQCADIWHLASNSSQLRDVLDDEVWPTERKQYVGESVVYSNIATIDNLRDKNKLDK